MRTALIRQNLELVRQGIAVVRGLSDEQFSRAEPRTRSAAIGEHFRHCIDFYDCFLRNLDSGRVDYDCRERDERVEKESAWARRRLEDVAARLEAMDVKALPDELRVRMDAPPGAEDAWASSTPERELQILVSHTVHHYALIALALKLAELPAPDGFGVARATLRHWESRPARGG